MTDRNKRENCINDNNGSVMLTVLIAFLLISVLVAMILSQTMMNFRMKAMDRRAKDEFYYVEKSLNDVYSGVGKDCAKKLGDVYSRTLSNSYNYTDESLAYDKFCEEYVKDLVALFYGNAGNVDLKAKLNSYLTDNSKSRAVVNNASAIKMQFYKKDVAAPVDTPNPGEYDKYNKIVIKDVYVSSVGSTGYKSSITTDIVISIPELSFFKVNENELDYALVGCKGLIFNGNANITGNVYGGVDKQKKIGGVDNPNYYTGGIQIYKNGALQPEVTLVSNYVVSASDVTVNDGNLKIENGHSTNDNEIWLENTVIGKKKDADDSAANITINGDTYALNDLQIEGKNKTVTIKGNYYGYGDGESTSLNPKEAYFKAASADPDNYYNSDARSKSSSIIVNASESVIDLSGLKNLILLGQAYIDHGSKFDSSDAENTSKIVNATDAKLSMDETGMSGTIKASQEILLVPEQFLTTSNPMRLNNLSDSFTVDNSALNQWISDNFGTSVKLGSTPTRTVKMQKNSKVYAYCYLQFDDTNDGDKEKYRSAYIKAIMNCDINAKSSDTEPTLQTLKKRMVAAAESQNSEILTDGISNVFAKNSGIVSFSYDFEKDDDGNYKTDSNGNKIKEPLSPFRENDIKIVNNESDVAGYVNAIGSLSGKYKDLTTFLDYNAQFSRGVEATDYAYENYPFGRLWWKNGIDTDASSTMKSDKFGCRVIIQGSSPLNLGSYLASNPMDVTLTDNGYDKLIVISTGDVIIDSDVKMKGFIFSNGKVIVNDGVTLEIISDLSVVQKRISGEVSDIKTNMPADPDNSAINSAYTQGYIIRYLLKSEFDATSHKLIRHCEDTSTEIIGNRRYNITTNEAADSSVVINSDYTSFVRFDGWKKTGAK